MAAAQGEPCDVSAYCPITAAIQANTTTQNGPTRSRHASRHEARRRERVVMYSMTWRNKWLTANVQTIEDMAACLEEATDQLRAMMNTGKITLDSSGGPDDYMNLLTDDFETAQRFGFTEVDDYSSDEDSEGSGGSDEGSAGGSRSSDKGSHNGDAAKEDVLDGVDYPLTISIE